PYYRWLKNPVTDAELAEAYRANALYDAHREDPEFGYRYLADEAETAGEKMCRRSAITDAPQTPQNMANTGARATNASGSSRQHNPLIESATTAAFFRPYLSAARPPARQPAYPTTPSVKKIIAWSYPRKSGEAVEFRTNNGIQVQRAYSSHM